MIYSKMTFFLAIKFLLIGFSCSYAQINNSPPAGAPEPMYKSEVEPDSVRTFIDWYTGRKDHTFYQKLDRIFLKGANLPVRQQYLVRLDTDSKGKISKVLFSMSIPKEKRDTARKVFTPLIDELNKRIFKDRLTAKTSYILTMTFECKSSIDDPAELSKNELSVMKYWFDFEDGKRLLGKTYVLTHLFSRGPAYK